MAEPLETHQVPGVLVDDAVEIWHEIPYPMLLDDQMRHILAAILPKFDEVTRAEIVTWIEAQMLKCPKGHDEATGHRELCNWCWHNGALRGAAALARGDHGSTPGLVRYRLNEAEATDG